MKVYIGLLLLGLGRPAIAQYFYKDIVLTKQINEKWKLYKINKVKGTILKSLEPNDQGTDGFSGFQKVSTDFSEISTYTGSNTVTSSTLLSFYNAQGLLQKTVDTSDTYQSVTQYMYDNKNHIIQISNLSLETDNQVKDEEAHVWQYDSIGRPQTMIKIKNRTDTTRIEYRLDEKGNVSEERSWHKKVALPTIYYYYDEQNRLTDIVRYSLQAQRLLPDYIFEYDVNGRLISSLLVREGSNDYQKWLYVYNDKGLESAEICYGKQKQLLGKIVYDYQFQ